MVENHQQIKDRLFKTASNIWGLQGTQTESAFDPLVGILLGACATELEKISHDIEETRGRTLERLVQLLYPEVLSNAIPAHAIVHAYPSEKNALLQSDAQFYYQKRFAPVSEGASPTWKNIYFTPTGDFTLHQASIKLIASTTAVHSIAENFTKNLIANNTDAKNAEEYQNSIWLAIENLDNLTNEATFYFELKHETGRTVFYDYLPMAKWSLAEKTIKTDRFYGKNIKIATRPNVDEIINGSTNSTNKILKHINKLYANRFITASNLAGSKIDNRLPDELKNIYKEEVINKHLGERVGWLRIDFPENIHASQLQDDLVISLNCMPVINRQLLISQQKLNEHINIIPLVSEGLFLDMAEVTDLQGNLLNNANQKEGDMIVNLHYGGVERFNEKNAVAAVEGLIQQLRDESSAYSHIGGDFLNTELKTLQQSLNKLEQQLADKELLKGETPYLLISSSGKKGLQNIYVKYWATNGEDGNNIKAGTGFSLYKNADVQSDSVKLVTNTIGGRDNLSTRDKVLAYKSALLSKEKLVTEEDIASFCRLRLALKNLLVEVKRGYQVPNSNSTGFTKTIDVSLYLNENEKKQLVQRADLDFWEKDLAMAITEQSNFFMPLRIFIRDNVF